MDSPRLLGFLVFGVTAVASVPLIGWMIKDKLKRAVAGVIAVLLAVALGLLVGRVARQETRTMPEAGPPATTTP